MIIPLNIYLNKNEQIKFERFINKNIKNIKGIFVLLNIKPFYSNLDLVDYYKYVKYITNKYKIRPIGFVNESLTNQYSKNLSSDIIEFDKAFKYFYSQGIQTIIRPYSWINYNFFNFSKLQFYIPQDSSLDMVNRILSKELFFEHLDYLENGIQKKEIRIKFEKSIYSKRLSIAHTDSSSKSDKFYKTILATNPKLLDEIDDIYFGGQFIYDDGFKYVKYGNVMGTKASEEQIDYLFKIQNELGINISLTLNSMDTSPDLLYDVKVLKKFIGYINKFYKKGLRVITISDIHLIKTGILQREFPLLKFKNTVNHKIIDVQSFVNFCNLGYDYIQLDRSLNRDIVELKKIKEINKKYNKKIYLLSSEFCMYNCPFKSEHDNINDKIISAHAYFDGDTKRSHISCDNWRTAKYSALPRTGVDLILKDKEALDEYLDLVDVLKFSGRLVNIDHIKDEELCLYLEGESSLEDKANKKLKSRIRITHSKQITNQDKVYDTKIGEQLLDTLKTCKNECISCHLCEKAFNIDSFDSLIELNGDF